MVVNHESEEICGISWGWQWGGYRERDGPNLYGTGRTPTSPAPRTHLQDEEEKEIGVGHFLELLKEVDRQEGDDVVLGGLDAVALGMERVMGGGGGEEELRPCSSKHCSRAGLSSCPSSHHSCSHIPTPPLPGACRQRGGQAWSRAAAITSTEGEGGVGKVSAAPPPAAPEAHN